MLDAATAALGVVLLYAFMIPVLVQSAPDQQTATLLSQLGTVPIICALIGMQLLVVARAMYADPGSKGCRSMPATPESWKARREIAALLIEGLQHMSMSFASEVGCWYSYRQVDPLHCLELMRPLTHDVCASFVCLLCAGLMESVVWD